VKPGDLVRFRGAVWVPQLREKTGLVLDVRRNPFDGYPVRFEFDALVEGVLVKDILSTGWMEAVR